MRDFILLAVGLLVGATSALKAETSKANPQNGKAEALARIPASRAARDRTKVDDIATLLRGVKTFQCELGKDVFPLVLLEDKSGWKMPAAPNIQITEIDQGYAFREEDDLFYLGFLKLDKGNWKLTELDDGVISKGLCKWRGEMMADAAEIMAPRILKNALELQADLRAAEARLTTLESQLQDAGSVSSWHALDAKEQTAQACEEDRGEFAIPLSDTTKAAVEFFEIPVILTGTLKDTEKKLDLGIGLLVSSELIDLGKIKDNLSLLTRQIIDTISGYAEPEITGRAARAALAEALRDKLNEVLIRELGTGVIDKLFLTYFAIE